MTERSDDFGQRFIAKVHQLIGELRNRRVIRTLGAYIALIWLLSQGFNDLFPVFGFPEWSLRAFVTISVTAIPLVALLSWKYDITREGIVPNEEKHGKGPTPQSDTGRSGIYEQKTVKSDSTDHYVEVRWKNAQGELNCRNFVHPFAIGRDGDVEIQLDDPRVSRHHVKVANLDGEWYIHDLNSSNGTFCDGERIEMQDLEDRCQVQLALDGPAFDISLHRLDGQPDTTDGEVQDPPTSEESAID